MLVSCTTPDEGGVKFVRYETSVQVALYDVTPRPSSPTLQVFPSYQEIAGRKYHVLARVNRSGNAEDEGLILNALPAKARRIGAQAMIVLPAFIGGQESSSVNVQVGGIGNNASHKGQPPVFRADAIVFD